MDLSRRKFIGSLLASAAVPVVVPKTVEYIVSGVDQFGEPVTEVWRELVPTPSVTIEQIRNMLLPGLQEARGRYEAFAPQWRSIFTEVPDTEV